MEEPAHKQTHPADTAADRSYLLKLLQPIKEAYETQTALTFRIAGARAKGFSVKVGGLFAYVPYSLFAWGYKHLDYWLHVGPKISKDPPRVKGLLKANQNLCGPAICFYISHPTV